MVDSDWQDKNPRIIQESIGSLPLDAETISKYVGWVSQKYQYRHSSYRDDIAIHLTDTFSSFPRISNEARIRKEANRSNIGGNFDLCPLKRNGLHLSNSYRKDIGRYIFVWTIETSTPSVRENAYYLPRMFAFIDSLRDAQEFSATEARKNFGKLKFLIMTERKQVIPLITVLSVYKHAVWFERRVSYMVTRDERNVVNRSMTIRLIRLE